MTPVDQLERQGSVHVVFGKGQPEYTPLPALVFSDGTVLTEWTFTEEERAAIAKGENVQVWIWTGGQLLQPLKLTVTDEQHA